MANPKEHVLLRRVFVKVVIKKRPPYPFFVPIPSISISFLGSNIAQSASLKDLPIEVIQQIIHQLLDYSSLLSFVTGANGIEAVYNA